MIHGCDITTIRNPITHGATNSMAHMMIVTNNTVRDFVSKVIVPFLDEVSIKGCSVDKKDQKTNGKWL